MLAHCAACGYAKRDYLDLDHPLQREIRAAVATMTGVPRGALHPGIDGCSAPNYAMPLARLALAFARLASADVDPDYGRAPRQLVGAMTAAPEMVSGEGRSDLALTRAGRGDWVCKVGAEAVQAIGIRSRGWGIAIKVADGGRRALLPATIAALDQAGLVDAPAREVLAPLATPTLRNARGLAVGQERPVVVLDKAGRPLTPVAAATAE
jgi:L-asparaginase II